MDLADTPVSDTSAGAADPTGRYERRTGTQTEWWRVTRSERANLYRVERGTDALPADLALELDHENLLAKRQRWQREGFVLARPQASVDANRAGFDFMAELRRVVSPPSAADATSDAASIEIAGVALPLPSAVSPLAPAVNPAYLFAAQHADVLHDIVENRRIMLIGHTGTGKTSLIEQIAARTGQGVIRANMNGQTTIGDFVGFWTVKGGETLWIDGVLPVAMRAGLWLIIDEIDFAEPAILAVLTAVLEPRGNLLLKERGNEVVTPHPQFRLFATANAVGAMSQFRHLYQGANLMNEAFLDRWRVYRFDYLSLADEAAVLVRTLAPRMTPALAQTLAAIAADCRAAFAREDLASAFSTRRLLDWAELMLRLGDPERAAEPTIYSKVSPEDAAVIRSIMRQHIVLAPAG